MDKLYIVSTPKAIIGMDGMQGPLTTPTKMKFADVLEMVRKGYVIYEVNPHNHNEKVKVTVNNIHNIKFKTSRSMGAIQRKLNRELQEMEKEMIVDVVNKDKKETDTKPVAKEQKKQNENKPDVQVEAVMAPDNFRK